MKNIGAMIGLVAVGGGLFFGAWAQEEAAPKKGGRKSGKSAAKKVELAHPFYWAAPDAYRGDWQGEGYRPQSPTAWRQHLRCRQVLSGNHGKPRP